MKHHWSGVAKLGELQKHSSLFVEQIETLDQIENKKRYEKIHDDTQKGEEKAKRDMPE